MKAFDYSLVKDPQYFCDNRMEAHSDHVYYRDGNEMQTAVQDGTETSFRYSLNGLWKFHYARNYKSTVQGFEKEDYCCYDWDDIHVPAHIQMEGYDAPQYANVQYPWEGHEEIYPGQIPERFNPVASYVKYFTVPEHMKGKRLFISFQGAESGLALWLNGTFVGYSEDSFTPSEFELTDYLKDGQNKLAAQVFKWTSSSWCEDQDFFRFSGIYRDVYLYTVPDTHVYDLQIRAVPEENLDAADLEVKVKIWGKGSIVFRLEKNGECVLEEKKSLTEAGNEEADAEAFYIQKTNCSKTVQNSFAWRINNPELWSAEDPQLYDLTIELYDEAGTIQEVIPQKVGFRRFEMKNGIMTLNGKRIVFKGVNRHEFSSVSGRHVSEEELRKDLRIMKQNNINAIRTCHYPDTSLIYQLCDEYGIYMIDETNLESHGSWDVAEFTKDYTHIVPHNKPEWLDMMLDRANSMYQRDKNHPAILIWSCGNESFGGKDIYEMSQLFRKNDPTRLVHYEGLFHVRSYNDTSDMESQMYPSVEAIKEFLAKDDSKPFICCEYTHAMGNSCGAMHKYTDLTDTEPKYQGGFIWDYIDQSIYKKDRYGKWFLTYGGDFGDRPTDGDFSGNGICYGGEREASPKMQEVKFNYQNISVDFDSDYIFTVTNKNLFVNTSVFDAFAILLADGEEVYRTKLQVSVPPMERASYEVPVTLKNSMIDVEKEYCIVVSFVLKENTIWEKAGYEIAFGQHMIKKPVSEYSCDKSVELVVGNGNILVRGENFKALFSRMNLGMVSYVYGGVEMLPNTIPLPNFWRTPTNNDSGNMMPQRYAQWKIASMYVTTRQDQRFADTSPRVEKNDNNIAITYTYFMPTTPQSSCEVTYRVFGDGTIETTLSYDPVKELGDMPEFGMMFKLDADYDTVKWYGLGPQETYADRQHGGKYGVYENKVADNIAEYLVPQESGNKCSVRYARVMDKKGRGMLFFGDELSFSALPYTPHELENAAHHFELPPVHYTVVRVAKKQMGVGGDDSWGSHTHPEYLLDASEKMEFTFCFRGI